MIEWTTRYEVNGEEDEKPFTQIEVVGLIFLILADEEPI